MARGRRVPGEGLRAGLLGGPQGVQPIGGHRADRRPGGRGQRPGTNQPWR
ncbi:MAG: hypothetical protein NT031_20815 [Planctomycetota bacterium]|nr:hypothetical protein [Planctomycetota bacterium]